MLSTACFICWHHGTASRGPKCFAKSKDEVPHSAATRTNPGLGGKDRGAAPDTTLGCRVKWSGYSCCSPPNMPQRCHSTGEPFSPSSNTTPKLSSAVSVLAYTRSSRSAGVGSRPRWMIMKTGRRTYRPHTPLHAMWLGERRVTKVNQSLSKGRPPGEVWHGGWLP